MSKNPLVSVIIPAYNHEQYVQETITSAINQTYENIELIVIDDGSKDNTWQKINEMKDICKERFINVVFETKPNGGTCETLNMLLSKSNGEYICLLASDDLLKPNAIEKQTAFLSNNPDYALCVGDNEIIDSESKIAYWDKERRIVYDLKKAKYKTFGSFLKSSRKEINFASNDFGSYPSLFIGNYITNGYLIRKSIFDKIGLYTKKAPSDDWWLMMQISKHSKLKYLDEVIFSYRWHSSNTIKNTDKIKICADKTMLYEIEILKNINPQDCLQPVLDLIEKGITVKHCGIKNLFEVIKLKDINGKKKIIKVFGFTVKTKKKSLTK